MILHTVKSSPFSAFSLQDCLKQLTNEDKLLLIGDAVVAVSVPLDCQRELLQLHQDKRLFVLSVDLEARGVEAKYGQVISYIEFVNLAIECKSQLVW